MENLRKLFASPFALVTIAFIFISLIGLWIGYHGFSYSLLLESIGVHSFSPIWGAPRGLRSDDWLVNLPNQISQMQIGAGPSFINPFVGNGEHLGVLPPVIPVFDFWNLFKPYLWGFYFGVDTGISWQWISFAFSIIYSAFLFSHRVLSVRVRDSLLLAIGFYSSTFIQFWTLNPAPHFSCFFVAMILLKKISEVRTLSVKSLGFSLLLAYTLLVWTIYLYPPFQVPLLLIIGIYGFLLLLKPDHRTSLISLGGVALLFFGAGLASWYQSHREVLDAIKGTVYPGNRFSLGGDLHFSELIGNTFFSIRHRSPPGSIPNLSEGGGFAFFLPWLVIPLCFLYQRKIQKKLVLTILISTAIFLIYQFLGFPEFLSVASLLGKTTAHRSLVVYGPLSILAIGLWVSSKEEMKRPWGWALSFWMMGFLTNLAYLPSSSWLPGLVVTSLGACAVGLMLGRHKSFGLALIMALNISLSSFFNPIHLRGFENAFFESLAKKQVLALASEAPEKRWVSLDGSVWDEVLRMIPVKNITGTHFYPDQKLWTAIDPTNEYRSIWNRYAHVHVKLVPGIDRLKMSLLNLDSIEISLNRKDLLEPALNTGFVVGNCFAYAASLQAVKEVILGNDFCAYKIVEIK